MNIIAFSFAEVQGDRPEVNSLGSYKTVKNKACKSIFLQIFQCYTII